jgi:HSP20 family protein
MSLVKREPRAVRPFEWWPTEDRFERMVRDVFGGFGTAPMKVEEFVEDDACVIRAELPGLDPDKDVELTVDDGMLHIVATREESTEEEKPDGFRSEFHYGRMERHMSLPPGAVESDIAATYRDGILEVRVPVTEPPAAAAKIPVQKS